VGTPPMVGKLLPILSFGTNTIYFPAFAHFASGAGVMGLAAPVLTYEGTASTFALSNSVFQPFRGIETPGNRGFARTFVFVGTDAVQGRLYKFRFNPVMPYSILYLVIAILVRQTGCFTYIGVFHQLF
jgi:hypothetical protein